MNPADWVLIGGIGGLSLLSLWRGFLHQMLSFSSLLLAALLGWYGKEEAGAHLSAYVVSPLLQQVLGFCLIFLAVMVGGLLLAKLLAFIVRRAGLGGLDRFLGFGFGVVMGAALAWAALAAARWALPVVTEERWWNNSLLIEPILRHGDRLLLDQIPKSLSEIIDIPDEAIKKLAPGEAP